MKDVQIIVLLSGERVIGNVEYIKPKENDGWVGYYEVENPKVIIPQKVEGKLAISLDPWDPFAKLDKVRIAEHAVTTVLDPIESVRKAYLQQTTTIAMPPPGMKVMS